MNSAQMILFFLPLMLLIMALEVYFLRKRGHLVDRNEYLNNIANGFGCFLVDALVLNIIFIIYKAVFNITLIQFPVEAWTYVFAVVAIDFVLYWSHRLGHTIPFLWAIHSVHHQGHDFNLSKGFRQPWFHKIYAIIFYLVLALIGIPLEVLSVSYLFNVLAQFWVHTKFIKEEIPYFSKIFMTPAQHRVHHGKNDIYIDKNFGLAFSIWDRLFKTYQPEIENVEFGIHNTYSKTNPVWANVYPIIHFVQNCIYAFNNNILIKYILGKSRIRENHLDSYENLEMVSIEELNTTDYQHKFSYISIQYVLLFVFSLTILQGFFEASKYALIPFVLLSFGILGSLTDNKKIGKSLEYIRIALTSVVLYYLNINFFYSFLIINSLVTGIYIIPSISNQEKLQEN